jgi:hypothetical protein
MLYAEAPKARMPSSGYDPRQKEKDDALELYYQENPELRPPEQGNLLWQWNNEHSIMARKSALEKIEYHEKICRLMQKQTFEQIQQLKNQIIRIERILIGTAAFVIISLLEKII